MTKLSNTVSPPEIRKAWDVAASVDFNVGKLKHLLDHDNHEMRDKFREFMRQPLFTPRYCPVSRFPSIFHEELL